MRVIVPLFSMGKVIIAGWLLLLVVSVLASCAPTSRTDAVSFIDPDYRSGNFGSLVVMVEDAGLQERMAIEHEAARQLNLAGIAARPSMEILPPTRDYDRKTAEREVADSGMQGLLTVLPTKKRVVEDYVPPSYYPGHFGYARHHRHYRDSWMWEPGFFDGGYVVREPQSRYEASLYTLPDLRRVWTAEFETTGSGGSDFDFVARQFGGALIKRLAQDGMIPVTAVQ